MSVEGVRIGDEPDADKDVWDDIWQRSDFDEGSQEAITAALVYSRSFVSVEPPSGGRRSPAALRGPAPGRHGLPPDGTRGPALKVFTDEWTGTTFGTLYTDDSSSRWSAGTPGSGEVRWVARDMGRDMRGDVVTATRSARSRSSSSRTGSPGRSAPRSRRW
jgi:hypothetical protein